MTVDEAMSEAVAGNKVTHDDLRGSYVAYPEIGKGFKRFFNNIDNCAMVFEDVDQTADWRILAEGWG